MIRCISFYLFIFGVFLSTVQADEALIAKGRKVYLSYGCAVCHGKEGRGDGINAKQFYPPATNLTDIESYQKGSSKDAMRGAIRNGINEEKSIMPAFKDIPNDQLEALLVYLVSLQVKTR